MSTIKIQNLCFEQGKKIIFDKISLIIKRQKITAIIGPSGCGKTTLLKLITKQLIPTSGNIIINNKNINNLNDKELCDIRKNIGILFQTNALFSDLSLFDNVAFPIREHTNLHENLIKDIVSIKLNSVGLLNFINSMPHEISTGMAKRAALARTIALDPNIIMYDEPFTGQDPISLNSLLKLINSLNKLLKITTIIVSHDIEETFKIADYVYIINSTRIIEKGTVKEIKETNNNFVKTFISKKFEL